MQTTWGRTLSVLLVPGGLVINPGRGGKGQSVKRGRGASGPLMTEQGLWDSGTLGSGDSRTLGREGAGMEGPAVKRKGGKDGFLFDGKVWVADGANKRPLGDS